ncbi:MAG TPA: hypothetical protein VGO58_09150 [Chitinophagaceae bacterium]|nr:hypothetical protein [Chitinophagaceae bacterium]
MKVLNNLQKQEEKIYRKLLTTKDSLEVKAKLAELNCKYAALKDKLKNPTIISKAKQYIPSLDSLNTSLKFLDQNGIGGKVKDALAKTGDLQERFQQAEEIRRFIRERKAQLKTQLEKLGMVKQLKSISKKYYYYCAQVREYKAIISDPKKIEKKALELLSKTKLFKDFMRKNSMLASFFPMPGGGIGDPSSQNGFAGLQTRTQVLSFIQNQNGPNTPSFASSLQRNIQSAQGMVDQLRAKANGFGSSEDLETPDFKPKNQKTKSFKQRLELGTNLQSQKSNFYFPTTTDLGFTLGYKINDNSVVGIGSSAKIGWGRDVRNIRVTGQGFSFRSFLDWKIKKTFYASGGFEYNYQQSFASIRQLYSPDSWKKSALLGITKIVSFKGKFFKKTKVQLLYDFFYKEQMPLTAPVKFRIGYVF